MNSKKFTELTIQQYVDGELGPSDLQMFEETLQTDPKLKDRVKQYKTLIGGIRYHKRKEAWDLIAVLEYEAQGKKAQSKGKIGVIKPLMVAASVILLFLLLAVLYNGVRIEGKYAGLVAEHFEPYPALTDGPVRGGTSESLKERAYMAYDAERYEEAITLLTQLVGEQYNVYDLFYLGNAHLARGNYKEAVNIFGQLAETDILFRVQTQWYLGLSHLGNNDVDQAKEIFKEISNSNTSYVDKATKILSNL